MTAQPVTLAFVGDVMLARKVSQTIATKSPEWFWGDVLPLLRSTNAVIANLECPITTYGKQWRRTWKAFRFRAVPAAINLLKTANVRFVNLANNHILDFEETGLHDTLDHLDAAGIAHAGVGRNSNEAVAPTIVDVGGLKVGFIALTDNMPEFAASHSRAGTNFIRISTSHATLSLIDGLVRGLRDAGAGFVVLTVHWGPNLRVFPPPRFRRFARAVLAMGVDMIHGHSAHLFQGVELHKRGCVLYDTGNFLDDYWVFPFIRIDRSFVFLVDVRAGRVDRIRMVPVTLKGNRVSLARPAEFEAIRRRMHARCRKLNTPVVYTSEGLEIEMSSSGAAKLAPVEPCNTPAFARPAPVFFAR